MKYARIDQEDIDQNSDDLYKMVLNKFNESVEQAEYVFAHNLNVNLGIVGAEMVRHEITNNLNYSENICLMQESTFYCKIPKQKNKGKGFKWPTLNELHDKIFKKGYHPGNNARADALASTRCFMALMKIGFLEDVFYE